MALKSSSYVVDEDEKTMKMQCFKLIAVKWSSYDSYDFDDDEELDDE